MEQEPKINRIEIDAARTMDDLKTNLEDLQRIIGKLESRDLSKLSYEDKERLWRARKAVTDAIGEIEYMEEESR